MKTKKNAKANLENTKWTRRQMSIMFALGMLFIAFEYGEASVAILEADIAHEVIVEIDHVPVTFIHKNLPPPPPPKYNSPDILIIGDDVEDIEDMELTLKDIIENSSIEIFDHPAEVEIDDDAIFITVEKLPTFPGGEAALMQYLQKNVKYPSLSQELGIQGRVFVEFVVNSDGSIVDVKILKGIDRSLDKEAMRVIKGMPLWIPGEQSGRKVRVSYRIPIKFALN